VHNGSVTRGQQVPKPRLDIREGTKEQRKERVGFFDAYQLSRLFSENWN
jgi:hypothetical protein